MEQMELEFSACNYSVHSSVLSEREKIILRTCRSVSEFIQPEEPSMILKLSWEDVPNHPIDSNRQIIKFLRKYGIPVVGKYNIEGVKSGRLYWDDYLDIGSRTFFYYKLEPKYLPIVTDPEYNGCMLICSICKEICGGISDHIEESGSPIHACQYGHKWLSIEDKQKVNYSPIDWPVVMTRITIEDKFETEEEEETKELERTISLEDIK